jgi:hypothetical protein
VEVDVERLGCFGHAFGRDVAFAWMGAARGMIVRESGRACGGAGFVD